MNIKRLTTALIGGPIVIALLVLGTPNILDALMAIIAIRSLSEYFSCSSKTCKPIKFIAYIFALLIAFIHIFTIETWMKILPILIPIFLLIQFFEVIRTDGKTNYNDLVYTTTGSLYLITLISFFSLLYGSMDGKFLVWYVIFSAWGSDIFAYIVGKHFGKHKFSKISPNKTIEGCVAGLIGACLICLIYTFYLNKNVGFEFNYLYIGIISIILGIIGQIGDFAASVIKRHFEVKDFSELFPGHGGMIDRIDSIIFIAPFAYYFLVMLMNIGG